MTTLADLLPDAAPMRMLIVGKTPALVSVDAGHYFQGRQGTFMWSELRANRILDVPDGSYEDDTLIGQGFGITDVVKVPREFGSEPDKVEYGEGWPRVAEIIGRLEPEITFWPYKGALDKVLGHAFGIRDKATYGFNPRLTGLIGSSVFVFGMNGTPCSAAERTKGMRALRRRLGRA